MVNIMKKHYIQLSSTVQQVYPSGIVCVGSVKSDIGLEYGGGSDGSDENQQPF